MTSSAKFRVVIDMQPDGDFLVYSDPEVEVISRCAGCGSETSSTG